MKALRKILTVATAAFAIGAPAFVLAGPASAAGRDGTCDSGEFCYYFNSGEAGSVSDFTGSLDDYGATQPSCYEFKGAGAGQGQCIKNNAASVWNRTGDVVRVYYNSGFAGQYQDFASGTKGNLNAALKNQNASHQVDPATGGGSCSTSGTGDPQSCAQAVAWAKARVHTGSQSGYYNLCDHLVALAYGFGSSGSTTALVHWTQIPASFKRSGSSVPAGGLAFFGEGSGHVMISIGGGKFISNDIHGNGSYTETTISEIQTKWGKPYLGWAQPWFKVNH